MNNPRTIWFACWLFRDDISQMIFDHLVIIREANCIYMPGCLSQTYFALWLKAILFRIQFYIMLSVDQSFVKVYTCYNKICRLCILNETSKPPLNIFSYILTYMIHTWLQFTLNMKKIN